MAKGGMEEMTDLLLKLLADSPLLGSELDPRAEDLRAGKLVNLREEREVQLEQELALGVACRERRWGGVKGGAHQGGARIALGGRTRVACNRPLLEGYRLLDRDEPLAPAHMRTSKYGRLRRGRQDGSIHQGKG